MGYVPIFTARKRSLGQGNMFTGVCLFTGEGSTWPGTPPQEETPPPAAGADTTPPGPGKLPPGADTPPKTRYTPQDQVHPPGPGTPPRSRHSPKTRYTPLGPGTQSMLGDTDNARAVRILLECNLVCDCNAIPIHSTEQNVILNKSTQRIQVPSICISNPKNLITFRNTINKLALYEPESYDVATFDVTGKQISWLTT